MKKTILIIDDDKDLCLVLKRFLDKKGYESIEATHGKRAIEIIKSRHLDLVVCDYRLGDMDGSEVIRKINILQPGLPVIVITGYSNIRTSVEVIKLGAFDYLTKPLQPDEILSKVEAALHETGRSNEQAADKQKKSKYIFTNSPEFENILHQISLVAPTNYSVIIHGESGSGKEAIAEEIHKRSARSHRPFVAIDCGALSKELAGSELFGHEKGAFTGAIEQKSGSFELANGGTIFLDEVSNLSYDIQTSLLRVIQERKVRKVGGIRDVPLDVRIIVACNKDLWAATQEGEFREDLYHRFNEFQITVPPLRQRKHDIMVFANHFLSAANSELGKQVQGFTSEVEVIFRSYSWPGNLRELKNVVKRAALVADGDTITIADVPQEVVHSHRYHLEHHDQSYPLTRIGSPYQSDGGHSGFESSKKTVLKAAKLDAEFEIILDTLRQVNNNKSKAAKILNINRKTIYNKIRQFEERHYGRQNGSANGDHAPSTSTHADDDNTQDFAEVPVPDNRNYR